MMRKPGWFSGWLAPAIVGLLGLLFFHRYTIHSWFDLVEADPGDSRFIVFLLENWSQSLRGKASWSSPPFFFPAHNTIAFSDLLLGPGLLFSSIRALGPQPFVAFNLTLVGLSLLSYVAAYWLAHRVLGISSPAAAVAAAFFAFSYPKAAQLVHAQLRFDFLIPIIFGVYWRLIREAGAQTPGTVAVRVATIVVLFVLQAASSFYNGWFFGLFLVVFSGYSLAVAPLRRKYIVLLSSHFVPLAVTLTVSALLCKPLLDVYRPVMGNTGGRPWPEVAEFLPHLSDVLWQGQEAYVWGDFFRRFPDLLAANWPERRIGFGFVSSAFIIAGMLWAIGTMSSVIRRNGKPGDVINEADDLDAAAVSALLLSALTLALLAIRWPSGGSGWEWVHGWVPFASGIRAVPRLFLVLSLPYALSLAWALDRSRAAVAVATGPKRTAILICVWSLVAIVLSEQCARTDRYSGRQAFGMASQVAALVDPSCPSFYLMPSSALRPPPLNAETFDPDRYLAANPDVALHWNASAWEHYETYGRKEARSLDPGFAHTHEMLIPHYGQTAALVAQISGVPTVNGYSGSTPPGYHLSDEFVGDIEQRIDEWAKTNQISRPCLITKDLAETDIMLERANAGR